MKQTFNFPILSSNGCVTTWRKSITPLHYFRIEFLLSISESMRAWWNEMWNVQKHRYHGRFRFSAAEILGSESITDPTLFTRIYAATRFFIQLLVTFDQLFQSTRKKIKAVGDNQSQVTWFGDARQWWNVNLVFSKPQNHIIYAMVSRHIWFVNNDKMLNKYIFTNTFLCNVQKASVV